MINNSTVFFQFQGNSQILRDLRILPPPLVTPLVNDDLQSLVINTNIFMQIHYVSFNGCLPLEIPNYFVREIDWKPAKFSISSNWRIHFWRKKLVKLFGIREISFRGEMLTCNTPRQETIRLYYLSQWGSDSWAFSPFSAVKEAEKNVHFLMAVLLRGAAIDKKRFFFNYKKNSSDGH